MLKLTSNPSPRPSRRGRLVAWLLRWMPLPGPRVNDADVRRQAFDHSLQRSGLRFGARLRDRWRLRWLRRPSSGNRP